MHRLLKHSRRTWWKKIAHLMVGRKQEEPTDKVTLQAHTTSDPSNQATRPNSLTLMFIPNSPLKMSCPEDQPTEPIWNLITSAESLPADQDFST